MGIDRSPGCPRVGLGSNSFMPVYEHHGTPYHWVLLCCAPSMWSSCDPIWELIPPHWAFTKHLKERFSLRNIFIFLVYIIPTQKFQTYEPGPPQEMGAVRVEGSVLHRRDLSSQVLHKQYQDGSCASMTMAWPGPSCLCRGRGDWEEWERLVLVSQSYSEDAGPWLCLMSCSTLSVTAWGHNSVVLMPRLAISSEDSRPWGPEC